MAKSMKHKRGLKGNKKSMRKSEKYNGKRKMLRSSHKSTTKDKRKGNHKVNSKRVTKKHHSNRRYKRVGGHRCARCGYCPCKCRKRFLYGGNGANIGYAWKGEPETWPGVKAAQGLDTQGKTMSNHFAVSKNGIVVGGVDPARSTSDDYLQKGGFLQEIQNAGRGVLYKLDGVYQGVLGKQQPMSPSPLVQPIDKNVKFIGKI